MQGQRPEAEERDRIENARRPDAILLGVGLVVAAGVIALVVNMTILIPNRQAIEVWQAHVDRLRTAASEAERQAADPAKVTAEIQHLEREIQGLTPEYTENFVQRSLQGILEKAARSKSFTIESVALGSLRGIPDDRFGWQTLGIGVTGKGPQAGIEGLVAALRETLPANIRLLDLEIKPLGEKAGGKADATRVYLNLMAIVLGSAPEATGPFAVGKDPEAPGVALADLRELQAEAVLQRGQLEKFQADLGRNLGTARSLRGRLESVIEQRSYFAARKQKEFDQLEVQLRGALAKANAETPQRIVIKVEEQLIKKTDSQ